MKNKELNTNKKIYALGDSHIRLIDGTILSPSFTAMSSYYNELLATNINSIINVFNKENDYLILCFGEIDIRMHISKYCIKDNIINMPKLYGMIEMVINQYMKTIIKYGKILNNRIIIFLPTASFLPPTGSTENVFGTNEQRNLITSLFNKKLANILKENNILHFSIFEEMINNTMQTKIECLEGGKGGLNHIHADKIMAPIAFQKINELIEDKTDETN